MCGARNFFQCIREVHAGRTFIPPAIAAKLAERLPGDELSPRELEVLHLLAEGKPNKLIGVALSITDGYCQEPHSIPIQKTQCTEPHRGNRGRKPESFTSSLSNQQAIAGRSAPA
jgi:FixJ family two-component response regulator